MKFPVYILRIAVVALVLNAAATSRACPFCSVAPQTLSEEAESADAVVLAKLIKEAPEIETGANGFGATDPNSGTATFEIIEVLRGQDALAGVEEINAVYFGEADRERVFRIVGLGAEKIDWTTPLPLSVAAVEYVRKLPTVPTSGPDRLAFFQEYLEHEDPLMAQDAYDEFARAPYDDVKALAPRMHHDQLVKWIGDMEVNPSRRRLYLTMLGVCGNKEDVPFLESMITSDFSAMEPYLQQLVGCGLAMGGPVGLPAWIEAVEQEEKRKKLGLDALVACYLTLRGPDGLDLIDQRFLKRPGVEYTHIYSTIMALRFHGDEDTGVLPRERLLASMRLLLDNPDFADQVILDLSRWEDWSVLDRLVQLFKSSDKSGYVRQPVITYLTVASDQPGEVGSRAATALEELERLDPETVKQARSLMAFGALGRARASANAASGSASGSNGSNSEAASTDRTQGYAASDADNVTDPADIPDPAAYEERNENGGAADSSADTQGVAASESTNNAAATSDKSQTANRSAIPAAEAISPPAPLLLVGLPLLGAVLLMGLYWLILRFGAV